MHHRDIKSLCPYCGVGCGIIATTDGSRITKVRGDNHHPANFGKLCPKGASVAQTVDVATRLRSAFIRNREGEAPSEPSSSSSFIPVSPSIAIRHAAARLTQIIQTHGPESVAFYLSGQMTT